MVSSWRVLLVTLAATTFSGASAQECSLEGQDSLCSSAVGLIDVCIGLDFFVSVADVSPSQESCSISSRVCRLLQPSHKSYGHQRSTNASGAW